MGTQKNVRAQESTQDTNIREGYRRGGESGPREIERLSVVIWIITPARRNWTIGLALLLYRRAKTKPAEYTATALGSFGPIAATTLGYSTKNCPGSDRNRAHRRHPLP